MPKKQPKSEEQAKKEIDKIEQRVGNNLLKSIKNEPILLVAGYLVQGEDGFSCSRCLSVGNRKMEEGLKNKSQYLVNRIEFLQSFKKMLEAEEQRLKKDAADFLQSELDRLKNK